MSTIVTIDSPNSSPLHQVAEEVPYKANIKGFDSDWFPLTIKLRALTSFVAQHEVDHLNGTTLNDI